MVPQVPRAPMVLLEQQDQMALQAQRALMAPQVRLEPMVRLAQLVLQVQTARQDLQVPQERLVQDSYFAVSGIHLRITMSAMWLRIKVPRIYV